MTHSTKELHLQSLSELASTLHSKKASAVEVAQHFLGLKDNEITNLEIKLKPNADETKARAELTQILGKSIKIKNRAQLNDSLYKMLQSENLFIYLLRQP